MRVSIVAGGAGFIGVNLCEKLLEDGRHVLIADNLSRGSWDYLDKTSLTSKVTFVNADLAIRTSVEDVFAKAASIGTVEEVWHLAANSDIPAGVVDADIDLKDTFLTTVEILRCMKTNKVGKIYFASSSAIYGNLGDQPLHESIGPLLPVSNYGAMKLASEALISASAESFLDRACLFRFPNVVGTPSTHGVILDFIHKLKAAQNKYLDVLGNGTQQKAYLHVTDLVTAMLVIRSHPVATKIFPVNIGPADGGVTVRWIAEQVVRRVAPGASIRYGLGNSGWVGDVPRFRYCTSEINALGWRPRLDSKQAILRSIDEIAVQEGVKLVQAQF